ncbi:glutaminyl-peptide cyclotransferase [Actinomycetospora sp. C-140]
MTPTLRWAGLACAAALVVAWLVVVGVSAMPRAGPSVLDDPPRLRAVGVATLRPEVLAVVPHDPTAYTEGLEIDGDAVLEGTGLTGRSQLRALDPVTGAVRRAEPLPPAVYGEGVTASPTTLWQLTYRDGIAYERDPATWAIRRTVPLEREGWGACHDGTRVVTSDGTDELVFRDPASFAPVGTVRVTAADVPVDRLNELECTADGVWANVWHTDRLVLIDPGSGRVTAVVDAAGLLRPGQRPDDPEAVLNGIAAVPGTDQFLLTGKYWPSMFRVRFVPS